MTRFSFAARPRLALVVLCAAVLVRVLAWQELSGSALLHLERHAVSDMNFFQRWAEAVAGGDVLLRDGFLPDNSELVCAVREAKEEWSRVCDETYVAETWQSWVGSGAYWQDPLYAYLVAGVYALWGEPDARVIYALQALLGVLSSLLAFSIGALLFEEIAGLGAGLLAALLGTGIYYETLLLGSSLLGFGALLCLWTLLRALTMPGAWWRALLAGICAGLFALGSTTTIGFVVLALPLSLLALRRGWLGPSSAPARFLAVFVIGSCLGFSPLIARNVAIDAPPFRSAVAAPLDFINGNALGASPRSGFLPNPYASRILAKTGWSLPQVVAASIDTYEHPRDWLYLFGGKLLAFFHWYELPSNANYYYFQRHLPLTSHMVVSWTVLVALAAVGVLFGLRRSPAALFVLAWVISTASLCAIFFNLSHLRFPAALALTPMAGHGLALIVAWARGGALLRVVAGLALAVAVGAATLAPWEVPFGLIRIDIYNAFNRIALGLSDEALARGDKDAALVVAEKQLRAVPEALLEVPEGAELGLDSWMAGAAGSFARLYRRAADLYDERGQSALAQQHRLRADVLDTVVREWKSAPRKPPAPRPIPGAR